MKKLLYDIEQLLAAKGKEAGICRVSLELLRETAKRPDMDVYPLATVKGNAEEYLRLHGLEKLAEKVVYLPYLKKSTKHYNPRQCVKSWLLLKLLRKKYLRELRKYDEYISIFSPLSPLVYESGIKTKLVVHDLIPLKFPQFCNADFARKYAVWIKDVRTDEVICVSESAKADFLAYRPDYPEARIKVAHLAASERFKPAELTENIRRKYGLPEEKYFLGVSEQSERKNFAHLVKAFGEFCKKNPAEKVCLVLVGAVREGYGAVTAALEGLAEYKERVVLTGFAADADMPALYSGAEVFVYPSLYEGFGLPVLEAMSCGCPVLTCDNSSLPEAGGDAAVYISGRDINETADALTRLHNNETLLAELRRKSFAHAENFSWHKTCENIFGR